MIAPENHCEKRRRKYPAGLKRRKPQDDAKSANLMNKPGQMNCKNRN